GRNGTGNGGRAASISETEPPENRGDSEARYCFFHSIVDGSTNTGPVPASKPSLNRLVAWFAGAGLASVVAAGLASAAEAVWGAAGWDWTLLIMGENPRGALRSAACAFPPRCVNRVRSALSPREIAPVPRARRRPVPAPAISPSKSRGTARKCALPRPGLSGQPDVRRGRVVQHLAIPALVTGPDQMSPGGPLGPALLAMREQWQSRRGTGP